MLSVVIPTYRKSDLLARTLGALAAQEVDGEWEVVVVDDGSDDGRTPEVLVAFRDRLPLVEAGCGYNEGRARARNRGWRAARGRWVLFLDDDIVFRPGAVQAHVEAQRRREACYLGRVVTAPEIIDSTLFEYLDTRGVAKCAPDAEVPSRYLLTQNVSLPRESLEQIGGFDEDFGVYGFEDMEIAFRLEDRTGLRFFSLPAAAGEHVHHHTLDEYLEKKAMCGRETLPQLARLHPRRMAEMRLDVLTGLPAGRRPGALGRILEWSWRLGGMSVARGMVRRWPAPLAPSLRHRTYDYLVLGAYAAGLREQAPAD